MRRTFTIASALSLLLLVGTAALWVRSYVACDALDWGTATGRAGVFSFRGRLGLGQMIVPAASVAKIARGVIYRAEPAGYAPSAGLKPGWSSWTGLQITHVKQPGFNAFDVRIPYWFLSLAAALPAVLWLARRIRPHRPGLCPVCGYDLRATPDRCPECGTRTEL